MPRLPRFESVTGWSGPSRFVPSLTAASWRAVASPVLPDRSLARAGFIPNDWREWRRLRVLQLKQRGWRQRDIAAALGASEVSVSRWLSRARKGGPEALLSRPAPGHPPKLSPAQRRLIPEFLWHGPEA